MKPTPPMDAGFLGARARGWVIKLGSDASSSRRPRKKELRVTYSEIVLVTLKNLNNQGDLHVSKLRLNEALRYCYFEIKFEDVSKYLEANIRSEKSKDGIDKTKGRGMKTLL